MFVTAQTAAARSRRAPRSRRSCAAPAACQDDEDRRRVAAADPRFPHQRRGPRISSTAPTSRATPGRRGHARPHHPHQELAADRARPRRRQARRLQARRARGRRRLHRHTTRPISRATTRASAASRSMLDPLPRVVLVPGLGLFGLGRSQEGRAHRRRSRRSRDRDHHRRRSDRPLRVDLRSRHVRHGILVARTGQARRAPRKPLAGQIAVDHRRRRRHRRRHRQGVRRRRRRGRAARCRRRGRDSEGQGDRRRGARGRAATSPTRPRCAPPSTQVVETFGGVDIVVSNAGAAWQGRIGEVDEAMLRKSFELNFYGHQRVAQAAVKIMLAQGTGGCLLFNVSKQAVNPGTEFRPLRPAEGGDAVPGAAIRARLRRRRHPRQCGQRRPHPLRPADRRLHRRALEGARRLARRTT